MWHKKALHGCIRFWKRFTRRPDRGREVQLLSVNGAAQCPKGVKTAAPGADAEAATANGTANGAVPLVLLERESVSPTAGLRQEKIPLSDDPFWDGE